ncbi:MAG TPA: hypothetical protein VF491_12465 [Vicinamibacterales bacterium]
MSLDQFLVIVHFLGLAMGLSTGFSNMIMAGLIAKAAPAEKGVLARFPPAMSRIGAIGLTLLWASGIAIVQTRYGSFAILPRTFVIKIAAVAILTLGVIYIHILMPKAQKGDTAAAGRIQTIGKLTGPLAIIAIIFAVITFG